MTLSSLKAEDQKGLMEGVPGHRLQDATAQPQRYGSEYYEFSCSCGQSWMTTATQAGRPSSYFTKSWRNHISANASDPDEIVLVGKVIKPRTTWEVKVINIRYQFANQYAQGREYWKDWGDPNSTNWTTGYPWAVVIDRVSPRGKKSKGIKTLSSSRTDAVRKALHLIDMEAERGFDVEYDNQQVAGTGGTSVIVPTFRNTITELLDRTDDVLNGNILDVEITMQEIDEVLGLIPVIQARRAQLAEIWDKRTVGLLT